LLPNDIEMIAKPQYRQILWINRKLWTT